MSEDRTQNPALSAQERAELSSRLTVHTTPWRERLRASIVLFLHQGLSVRETARRSGCTPRTVRKWRDRFLFHRLEGLNDSPRTGTPPQHQESTQCALATLATASPPSPYGAWTHQRLAQALREEGHLVSPSWVTRTLKSLKIKVHQVRGWLNRKPDPLFDEKLEKIHEAVSAAQRGEKRVVCLDEKTGVSVHTPLHLDVFTRGRRLREFEYKRNGTLSWYAFQDCQRGKVSLKKAEGRCDSEAFTLLLEKILEEYPGEITLIMDNGSSHTSKWTQTWLKEHPCVSVLYTPVHASWANPVEVVFSVLTRQVLRHGFFANVEDLDQKARLWAELRNQEERPVQWSWEKDEVGTNF